MNYLDYETNFSEDTYFCEQMNSFSDEILAFRDLYNIFMEFHERAEYPQDWLSLVEKIHLKVEFKDSEFLQMLCAQSILNALEIEEDFETALAISGNITNLPLFDKSERLQTLFAISLMKCLELSYDSNENIILDKFRYIPFFEKSKNIHSLYSNSLNTLIFRTPLTEEKLVLVKYYPQMPGYMEDVELQRLYAEALMEIAGMAESLQEGKRIALMIKSIPGYEEESNISDFYCQSLIHLLNHNNSQISNNELLSEIFSFEGFNDNEMLQHAMIDHMKKSIDEETCPEDIMKILNTATKLPLLHEVEVIHLQYLDLINSYCIALARKKLFGDIEWSNLLKTYNTAINLPALYPYETANVVVKFLRLHKCFENLNLNLPTFQAFKDIIEKWLKCATDNNDTIKLRMMGAGISYIRTMFSKGKQREIEELTDKYCSEHQELFNNIDSLWNSFVNMKQ